MTYLMGILLLAGIFFGIALIASVAMTFLIVFFGDDYDMEYDRDGRNKNSREQKSTRW